MYNIYTLVYLNSSQVWTDYESFGCFKDDAIAAALKGIGDMKVAIKVETYKRKAALPFSTIIRFANQLMGDA